MKIEFTGRQTEIPEEVRRLAERKLEKVGKLLPSLTRAHVILSTDRHRQVAEVSVHSRRLDLAAVESTANPRLSVAGALDKLLRQAQRQRAKRQERKGSASPRLAAPAPERESDGGAPRVVRSRRVAVKPMTLEEAALEMGGRGDGVLVFRDAATERVGVLFRRRDGNLGLIEPEA
ncbi:MAG TPA: ribosome-associated translation inhibitor RaiA [Vicinamibacteria bacterium]|nr:ribosome-associated translation inhibitor RaiA [Vicinamibacteria bacterium]